MAVATPVLERTQQADELHNSLIKERYAKLINPETKLSDLRPQSAAPVQEAATVDYANAEFVAAEPAPVMEQAPVAYVQEKPYLVENARADADIFRADSAINRKVTVVQPQAQPQATAQIETVEEENEDLRPTSTTMQFTTQAKSTAYEEGKIENTSAEKRISLSKRDKIAIAVVVAVIVALFALIIINSAIISGLNNDLSSLQSSLISAKMAYAGVSQDVADYNANLSETVRHLAESLGMVK